jgi:hypothetical protein
VPMSHPLNTCTSSKSVAIYRVISSSCPGNLMDHLMSVECVHYSHVIKAFSLFKYFPILVYCYLSICAYYIGD